VAVIGAVIYSLVIDMLSSCSVTFRDVVSENWYCRCPLTTSLIGVLVLGSSSTAGDPLEATSKTPIDGTVQSETVTFNSKTRAFTSLSDEQR
jgi:hypothetical protein